METMFLLHQHHRFCNPTLQISQTRPTQKKSTSVVLQFYEPMKVISKGSYGVVWRAKDRTTGEIVALKHELHGLSETTIREIRILKSLPTHPCVVGFRRFIHDNDGRVYVAMEHLRTDLSRFMAEKGRRLTRIEVKKMMRQILEGVNHLHENGVMHRDIKPANILMNGILDLKICDFGLSRKLDRESGLYTPGVGTRWYKAPEVLIGGGNYTEAIDIWSVGCIMAEFVINEVLFPGNSEINQLGCICNGIVGQGLWLKVAAAAARGGPALTLNGLDLLQRLLAFEPEKRISAKDALSHGWFKE